jgi:hypothetical protein
MTRTEILQKTREILADEKHWTQKAFVITKFNEGKPFFVCCLMGAMNMAIADSYALSAKGHQEAQVILLNIIKKKYVKGYASLIPFNDDEERTHLDIIELLDEGIVKSLAMNHDEAAKENHNV